MSSTIKWIDKAGAVTPQQGSFRSHKQARNYGRNRGDKGHVGYIVTDSTGAVKTYRFPKQ